MPIQIFVLLQEERINEVKQTLENEWIKELMDIYQEELSTMGKNKRQAIIFFEANATLMSNQLRRLIEESLTMYKEFFERFFKSDILTPEQVILQEKDAGTLLEDVFLVVKLKDEDNQVVFYDALDHIKEELIRII